MVITKLTKIRSTKEREDRGFTLIELLVVVVIIGILIAIAIPLYLNYQKGAKDKSAQSDLRGAITAINQCYADNGNVLPASVSVTGAVGTPAGTNCTNDTINLSTGTLFSYKKAADGTYFVIATSNSGGTKNASQTTLDTATSSGSTGTSYYLYNSSTGGSF